MLMFASASSLVMRARTPLVLTACGETVTLISLRFFSMVAFLKFFLMAAACRFSVMSLTVSMPLVMRITGVLSLSRTADSGRGMVMQATLFVVLMMLSLKILRSVCSSARVLSSGKRLMLEMTLSRLPLMPCSVMSCLARARMLISFRWSPWRTAGSFWMACQTCWLTLMRVRMHAPFIKISYVTYIGAE